MKPGSSDRCKARLIGREALLRCRRRKGHDGYHQAPQGRLQTQWLDAPKATA